MKRISKHGTRYSEGSSQVSPDCYPRVCESCGERILVSKVAFENRCDVTRQGLVFRARHIKCPPFTAVKLEATAGAVASGKEGPMFSKKGRV